MVLPDRRTLLVLASLIAAMTVTAGVLMLLEPGPVAPVTGISLTSIDHAGQARDTLFATSPAPQASRWGAIVIHHSDSDTGSAKSIGQFHEKIGIKGGLGYHFIIGNGKGAPDGQVEVGYRWRHQLSGVHASGSDGNWYNRYAIAICVVGDGNKDEPTPAQMRELYWLVQQLQARFHMPASRVFLHSDIAQTNSPGKLFPVANFRQQLLPIPEAR